MKIPDDYLVTVNVQPIMAKILNEVAEFAGIHEDTMPFQLAKTLSACAMLTAVFVRYASEHGCVLLDEESLRVELEMVTESLGGNASVPPNLPKVNVSAIGQS